MSENIKIGLVLYNLDSSYQATIYHGIKKQTEKHSIQLFSIAGEPLDSISIPAMQFHMARKFLPLDGLLVLSSIYIDSIDHADTNRIEKVLGSVPVLSLGSKIDNLYSLTVDIYKPYKELIIHLIKDHGYRKFLYIGGSESNPDNVIREKIVKEVIEEHNVSGITLTIMHSEYFSEYEGIRLIREYQIRNNLCNIDTIIAGSDDMAIGIKRFLNSSSHNSWVNCPIIGFDNIPKLQTEFPDLTTIHQPLEEMGQLAVDLILQIIKGHEVKRHNTISAIKMVRSSCGCTNTINKERERPPVFDRWEKQHLRESSYFGQTIMNTESLDEIIPPLMSFLQNLGILDFFFIMYPEHTTEVPEEGFLLYEKNRAINCNYSDKPEKIVISEYFKKIINSRDLYSQAHNIFHLYSGNEQLGIVMYSTGDDIHSFMSHCGVFLSQTLKRLQVLKREKEYTEELKKEVYIRTRELQEEAKRRVEVEAEVLRISELERQRFSMDLHDDICQRLATVYMISEHFARKNPEFKQISDMLKETMQRTRQYAHDSFPMELEEVGLKESLERLCRQWSKRDSWKCNLDFTEELCLSRQKEVNIYRIVQEALFNAHKHSGADEVSVSITLINNSIELRIKDNGCGNSELVQNKKIRAQNRRPSGLGLRSMEYRAHQLDGNFNIVSTRDQGTEILVKIPIKGE